MDVMIIDGGSSRASERRYDEYLRVLARAARDRGHVMRCVHLAQVELRHCSGCWSCWTRTPGRCAQRDDVPTILEGYLRADLVVFATPLRLGFVSALTKTLLDRLVPLFLPHIVLHEGECVHAGRYARYPRVGCLLHRGDYDARDLEITTAFFERYALHFASDLALVADTERSVSEVCDAMDDLQRLTPDEAGQHRVAPERPRGGVGEDRGAYYRGTLSQ